MKKNLFVTLIIFILGLVGVSTFSVLKANSFNDTFGDSVYILQENVDDVTRIDVEQNSTYKEFKQGYVKLESTLGSKTISSTNFVHHTSNEAVESFADGTLLDLNDLSNNFINYYFIPSGMEIVPSSNGTYTAATEDGSTTFGENIWKLSDNLYLIQSPTISVHASDNSETVNNYIQVSISEDGIATLMSEDKIWRTIAEDCFVETQNGIQVYPIQELITDGNYKLSLAKIDVDPDDAIVLSEGETRRQIVPEIKIEAIDGKDGVSGETGEDGAAGEDGGRGGDARKGTDGNNVNNVSSVNSALPVISFADWQVTTNSVRGLINIVDESGFLDAIGSNNLSDTHPATVTITNNETGEIIDCYPVQFDRDQTTQKISYKLEGGVSSSTNFEDMYKNEEVAFTTVDNPLTPDTSYNISISAYYADISTGSNETIYYREFLSRNFYTDSAGVSVAKKYSDTKSITVDVNTSLNKRENLKSARIFLLTGLQNDSFNFGIASALNGSETLSGYLYAELNYSTKQAILHKANGETEPITPVTLAEDDSLQVITFSGLESDKVYYARVFVTDSVDSSSLTSQNLEIKTLKSKPTYDTTAKVNAYFNRVTSGFEVYRPKVTDPDAGIVKYLYTVVDSSGKTVQTRDVYSSESEPVVFFLSPGTPYIFRCNVEFFDNDKTSYFSFVESDAITSYGSSLPKLILTSSDVTSSTFDGNLQIQIPDLNEKIFVGTGQDQYLQLDIYADEVYDQTIIINAADTDFFSGNTYCKAVYLNEENTNYLNLALSFTKLFNNTNYTITVTGCIDLNDGNGPTRRSFGAVSFMTREMPTLIAKMSIPEVIETEASIVMNLQLKPKEDTNHYDFALNQLLNGEVTVGLYSGTNQNKNLIVNTTLKEEQIQGITEDGIIITEETFGSTAVNPNSEYTIVVESVSDSTYNAGLEYINYFDVSYPNYLTLNADAILPDLLEHPETAMRITAITNRNAENYGGSYDRTIPEDTIVGYRVQSKFDNTGRMAKYINYYVYEWSNFVTSVMDGIDPIMDYDENSIPKTNRLYQVSIDAVDSNDLPSIVLFFGNDPQTGAATTPLQSSARYYAGNYVFYAGKPTITDGELQSGMARGFKYTFAYTVTHETKTSEGEGIYPYSYFGGKKGTYDSFRPYGAGILNGVVIVHPTTQIYVLNSGMVDAPSIEPRFNTYVYESEIISAATNTNPIANGKVTIHYHYSDPDKLIVETGNNATMIQYYEGTNLEEVSLVSYESDRVVSNEAGNEWYQITVPYSAEVSSDLYSTTDYVQLFTNVTSYNGVKSDKYIELLTTIFGYDEEQLTEKKIMCMTPVDWSWHNYFEDNSEGLYFSVDSSTLEFNYFTIYIDVLGTQYYDMIRYAKTRGAMVEVTTRLLKDDGVTLEPNVDPDVFNLPLQCESVENESRIEAYLTTGLLGSKYLNRFFRIECNLKYEDGRIGTRYTELNNEFVIRNFNYDLERDNIVEYTGFVRSKSTFDIQLPNGSILIDETIGDTFSKSLRDVMKDSYKFKIPFKYTYTNSTTPYYAYPYNFGFMLSTGSALDSSVNDYSVVKNVASLNISPMNSQPVVAQLANITPTILDHLIAATATTIKVTSFNATGIDSIQRGADDLKKIGVAIYTNKASAENLLLTDRLGDAKYLTLVDVLDEDTEYNYVYDDHESSGNIAVFNEGIVEGGVYYVAFFANVNGADRLLLNAADGKVAVYQKSTLSSVSVTVTRAQYYNYGYFDKSLEISYALSSYGGLDFRYDIYSSVNEANDDEITYQKIGENLVSSHTINPVISYEELVNDDRMNEPPYYSNGSVRIILNPGQLRARLIAGTTYTVRMTAYEKTSNGATVLGHSIGSFLIPAVQPVSSFISLSQATSESITYLVSISDAGYYIMGDKEYPSTHKGEGLYSVRFTYEYEDPESHELKERLLITDYDGLVWTTSSSEGLKKEFVLDNSHLIYYNHGTPVYDGQQILPGTKYTLHVFAVCDFDEDGLSELTDLNDINSRKTWNYFFQNIQIDRLCPSFNGFIDTFWPIEAKPSFAEDTYKAGIKEKFEIGSVSQRTLNNGENYYVNPDYASFVRSGTSRLMLRLSESFNIAEDNNTQQAFKKIAYSVTGVTSNNTPLSLSGESKASRNDPLFIKTESYGYTAYEYILPTTIEKGRYSVTIQLYENESDPAPAITISKVYTD